MRGIFKLSIAFFLAFNGDLTSSNSAWAYYPTSFQSPLQTIALGSCNFQRKDQSHWKTISKSNPDLWIWMGDNIYADHLPASLKEGEYNLLRENTFYKAFRNSTPIIGTWDDHDFSSNGAGGGAGNKPLQQRLALNFLDEPQNSPRRNQEGIYTTYVFGTADKSVRVILLDVRYYRDNPGANATILGEAQWSWLTSVLNSNTAALTLLVTGSQVFPFESGGDSWQRDFPKDFNRLISLLNTHLYPLIILSGDRHFAEISKATITSPTRSFSVYEFTASGMTHSTELRDAPNRYRVGQWMPQKNFGIISLDWSTWPRKARLEMHAIDGRIIDSQTLEF